MRKPRLFIDMDGVTVDFDNYRKEHNLSPEEIKQHPHAYLRMQPIKGALEAIAEIISWDYFEVWMATKPLKGKPFSYSAKAHWIFHWIPALTHRLIMTPNKGLLGCSEDVIVDDHPERDNVRDFPGMILQFHPESGWTPVLENLRRLMELRMTIDNSYDVAAAQSL